MSDRTLVTLLFLILFGVGTLGIAFGRTFLVDRFKDAIGAEHQAYNRRRSQQGYSALAAGVLSWVGVVWLWWVVR